MSDREKHAKTLETEARICSSASQQFARKGHPMQSEAERLYALALACEAGAAALREASADKPKCWHTEQGMPCPHVKADPSGGGQ